MSEPRRFDPKRAAKLFAGSHYATTKRISIFGLMAGGCTEAAEIAEKLNLNTESVKALITETLRSMGLSGYSLSKERRFERGLEAYRYFLEHPEEFPKAEDTFDFKAVFPVIEGLNERDALILKLSSEDWSNKAIADRLAMKPGRVQSRLESIRREMGILQSRYDFSERITLMHEAYRRYRKKQEHPTNQ